jgi:hypothetical protein
MLKIAIAALIMSVQASAGDAKPTITATAYGPGVVKFLSALDCKQKQPKLTFMFEGLADPMKARIDPNLCRLLYFHSLDVGNGPSIFTFYVADREIIAFMLHDEKRNPEGRLEIKPIE